jgi:hypothetical protein
MSSSGLLCCQGVCDGKNFEAKQKARQRHLSGIDLNQLRDIELTDLMGSHLALFVNLNSLQSSRSEVPR